MVDSSWAFEGKVSEGDAAWGGTLALGARVIGPSDNQITLDHPRLVHVAACAHSSNDVHSRME